MRTVVIGRTSRPVLRDFLANTLVDNAPLSVIEVDPRNKLIDQIHDGTAHYEIAVMLTESDAAELPLLRKLLRAIPVVILVTTDVRIRFCIQAMRLGAWDYIDGSLSADLEDPFDQLARSLSEGCAVKRVREGTSAAQWVHSNFERLARDFRGKWVAVQGTELIDAADTHEELVTRVTHANDLLFWRMPETLDLCETQSKGVPSWRT